MTLAVRAGRVAIVAGLLAGLVGYARAADLGIVVTDSVGRQLPDAIAYLIPDGETLPPLGGATAMIDQINRMFVPAVSVIRTGTAVRFPNSDDIRHSVYSFSPAKTFTLKLYSGVPAQPVVFDKPGVVVLGCNIHDSMLAYVKVVDTPYFGKSGGDGRIALKQVPAGRYVLHLWHPWLAGDEPQQTVVVGAGSTSPLQFALRLQAPPAIQHH